MRVRGLVLLLIVAVPAAAGGPLIQHSWLNLFETVDGPALMAGATPCESSEFRVTIDGQGVLFREATLEEAGAERYIRDGYLSAGCGTIRHDFVVPFDEWDHIHARFDANREVDRSAAFAPIDYDQTVIISGMAEPVTLFDSGSGNSGWLDVDHVQAPAVESAGYVEFRFQDNTYEQGESLPGAASGVHVEGGIRNLEIEYSLIPAEVLSVSQNRRAADGIAVRETLVEVNVPGEYLDAYEANIQIRAENTLVFNHVIFPDGTVFRDASTRSDPGPDGFDHTRILMETFGSLGIHQVTVPKEIVRAQGSGTYTVVFHESNALEPSRVLMPLAVGAVILPGGAAGLAGYGIRRLQREEHHSVRRAGTSLLRGLILVVATYLAALALILLGPGIGALATPPATPTVVLSYTFLAGLTAVFAYMWYHGSHVLVRSAREQSATLHAHAQELARSNRDLEEFAQIASHDLKEPLRTIRGYTSLLQSRYGSTLDPEAKEYLDFAASGADRMGALLDGLMAYSTVDGLAVDRGVVNMNEVVQQVRDDLRRHLKEADARVTQDALPDVPGSPSQLAQAIMNIIANAVKYRSDRRRLAIHIGAKDLGDAWRFEFKDNGMGMEPASAARAFEMFYSSDSGNDRGSRGVGLAVVRRVVERHGGTCGIASMPDQGSRVWFTLPKRAQGVD